jgi:hypothetical protein
VRFEQQVYSQNGEDGAIDEIFRRIGTTNRCFVEMGCGEGLENNGAYRLLLGWKGLMIEGNPAFVEQIRRTFHAEIARGRLRATAAFIDTANVNQLIADANLPDEIDLLSLDIDMNTLWVWRAITKVKPRVVVIEYNSQLPPSVDWSVAYKPDSGWYNNSHMGASLKALELSGRAMGYELVGCDLTGTNAYFVERSLVQDKFADPFTSENHYEPPRYELFGRTGHAPGYGPGGPTNP